jgi:hypothetical protein
MKCFILLILTPLIISSDDEVNNFSTNWELHMSDYTPDFVNVIPLPVRRREIFYEHIKIVPTRLRGAFLLDESKEEVIDFEIIDTQGNILRSTTASYDIFDMKITETGVYKIVFANEHVNS